MSLVHRAVLPLKIVLAVLFAVLVMLQTFSLPGQFAHMAQQSPDQADLRWPLTAIAAVLILCVQVVIVSTWRLLGLVEDDRIFSDASLRWVDAIVGAVAVAWAVVFALFLVVGFRADDPGPPLLLFLLVTATAALGLLMVVMRALLAQATTLRTDMEAVI